jgi:cytochrome c peroxidase
MRCSKCGSDNREGRKFCASCGTLVADGDFKVNGHFSDDKFTTRDSDFGNQTILVGLCRTKTLRQIAETAPYFRDRQDATLDDMIEFYDRGGDPEGTFLGGPKETQPLHLSTPEKQWLKAFLKTLTGEGPAPVSR